MELEQQAELVGEEDEDKQNKGKETIVSPLWSWHLAPHNPIREVNQPLKNVLSTLWLHLNLSWHPVKSEEHDCVDNQSRDYVRCIERQSEKLKS